MEDSEKEDDYTSDNMIVEEENNVTDKKQGVSRKGIRIRRNPIYQKAKRKNIQKRETQNDFSFQFLNTNYEKIRIALIQVELKIYLHLDSSKLNHRL